MFKPPININTQQKVITSYLNGKSTKEIAKDNNLGRSTIYKILNNNNIRIKNSPFIPTEEKFWNYVKVGNSNECWEWQAGKGHWGYGEFRTKTKKHIKAHRFSWILANGEIPDNLQVLHHCDNPGCVNPSHLFLGTQKDNILDMIKKGRKIQVNLKGENTKQAKISNSQAIEIRTRYSQGEKRSSLSKEFGLSYYTVWNITKGRTWKHLL